MSDANGTGSTISADVKITGTVETSGSIRIDGTVEGDLKAQGDVVIGKTAQMKGNVSVKSVSIGGNIDGNVNATDRVELKSTSRIKGDIQAQRLAMEDGVEFTGHVQVSPKGATSAPLPKTASKPPETPKPPAAKV